MPWCDSCDEYRTPNSLNSDGECSECGSTVDDADMKRATAPTEKVPWHFWLMVVALVAYLGWRLVDGIIWVADKI